MTDCLNFGNPQDPEMFYDFVQSVKGLSEAAKQLWYKESPLTPVPFISGNVSFYNENDSGTSIDPSPIVCAVGVIKDVSKSITIGLKECNSLLLLFGKRKNELGGSVYYSLHDQLGKNIPELNFISIRGNIYSILDCVDNRLLLSCHDISDGGLFTAISEMVIKSNNGIGAELDLNINLSPIKLLFSETPGFIAEIKKETLEKVEKVCKTHNTHFEIIGKTVKHELGDEELIIRQFRGEITRLKKKKMIAAWEFGLDEALL